MSSRAHQRWALFAASLLLLVSVVNLLVVDHRRSPVWVDLTLFGMAEVLLLVAYSWITTVVVPRSVRLRGVVLVALLLLYAVAAAIMSLSWVDTSSVAPLLPVLVLGCVLGVLAWVAVKSVRQRGQNMARGWGSRIGIAVAVFVAVTLLTVIPSVYVAAEISCWGVEVKDGLDPDRYCAFGGFVGLFVTPVLGLAAAALYVLYDSGRHRSRRSLGQFESRDG